jgi:hypothetical protein
MGYRLAVSLEEWMQDCFGTNQTANSGINYQYLPDVSIPCNPCPTDAQVREKRGVGERPRMMSRIWWVCEYFLQETFSFRKNTN